MKSVEIIAVDVEVREDCLLEVGLVGNRGTSRSTDEDEDISF